MTPTGLVKIFNTNDKEILLVAEKLRLALAAVGLGADCRSDGDRENFARSRCREVLTCPVLLPASRDVLAGADST